MSTTQVIDLHAYPYCPEGWRVHHHHKGGQFEWDSKRILLYLSESQKEKCVHSEQLLDELGEKVRSLLNANALDWLLAHPYLIPEEWKGQKVCFWGTLYTHPGNVLCVRYLYWHEGQWRWWMMEIDEYSFFSAHELAALLVPAVQENI